MDRVGFIGVGLMGHGMAHNILAKRGALSVLGHRRRDAVDSLVAQGAIEAPSLAELARACDAIFLCVPGTPEVESLILGAGGLRDSAARGLIVIDCSTSEPASTHRLAALLAKHDIAFCDAPLGGTPAQASQGQLSAIVGCDAQLWPRIEALVSCFATKRIRVGPAGSGHQVKLLMNFLSLGYAALYAEMLTVAKKSNIDAATLDEVIRGSRMDCGVYQTYFRWVLDRDREAHKFTVHNAHKDLRYLAAMAAAAGVPDYLGTAVKNYYAAAESAGHGEAFVPMLSDIVAATNGIATLLPA